MRCALLVVLLCSCTEDRPRPSDVELHEKTTCHLNWSADTCEVPCADTVRTITAAVPPECIGSFTSDTGRAETWDCHPDFTFDYEGVRGCCARIDTGLGEGNTIYFAACE